MSSKVSPLAGKPVDPATLVNVPRLVTDYFALKPDVSVPGQRVSFGTSGHRGSSFDTAFNEAHILAITQAICDYRKAQGIDGPLFIGKDTHALSEPAFASAIEVLVANGVATMIDAREGYTPTPAVSRAIIVYNKGRTSGLADGIIITPSHNPPQDGGFKYNPPHGGPAGSDATDAIQKSANAMIADGLKAVRRLPYARAMKAPEITRFDYIGPYVADLADILDMEAIRSSGVNIGIDPLGGAAVHYWQPVIEHYGLNATVLNPNVDPTFRFMSADWDGQIRMDCSSPYAMAHLIHMRSRFDVAFANDTDTDRHGIVTPSSGLMNPNHYLTVAASYLFQHRPQWSAGVGIGKTVVSSSTIDRIAAKLGRRVMEVPVGFKWFVEGLTDGTIGFVGEESAGGTFLRKNGAVWSTDKDGLIMGLLAAEITAVTGRDPGVLYEEITREIGAPCFERVDATATPAQKAVLKNIRPEQITSPTLAGEPILERLSNAPGNGEPIGGIKVVSASGWFAARPSGTEDVYKIYAESFRDEAHLREVQKEAQEIVSSAFKAAEAAAA